MSQTTVLMASQPSQLLSPYTPRPQQQQQQQREEAAPSLSSSALLLSLSRSSSTRSTRSTASTSSYTASKDLSNRPPTPESKTTAILSKPSMLSTTSPGYSSRPSSLKPRPLPSPIHPRRRSWFREDDPSAFEAPSPDPSALSPMATFRSSMSEDEQRDELFSEASSRTPSSLYSLSPYSACYSTSTKPQDIEEEESTQTDRPFSIVNDNAFLAIPARARSDSARSHRSNPAVILNAADDTPGPEIPRRASEGGVCEIRSESTKILYYDTGFERSGSLAFGTKSQQKKSVWERSFRRDGENAFGVRRMEVMTGTTTGTKRR